MLKAINLKSKFITFGVPLLMILSMFLLTKSNWYLKFPKELSIGITLDLLFTIPLVYFFLIQKKEIPKITVVSIFIIGLVTASFILPENHQSLLSQVKTYFLPIVELGILMFLLTKIRKIVKEFQKTKNANLDFYDAIQIACKENFPGKLASLLATEIAVIYYGFFIWKKKKLKENEFTNYKDNGLISILLALLLVVFIETFAIHKFAEKWSVVLAWILTITSVYTAFQIYALLKSLLQRPIIVDEADKQIILRFGFFGKAIIPFEIIDSLVLSSKDLPEDKSVVYFSPLGSLGGHNIILSLKEEIMFESFYGTKKQAKFLAVFVDEKDRFTTLIRTKILIAKS